MNRMYSVLTVKAVEEEQRIIRGTATTPNPDRVGDIVEPLGVQFKNPMPLLHQHDHDKPVGSVTFEKPTKEGITFEATLPKIDEAGPLRDRVETAWGEIKAGLVRAVSIGFRALEYSWMDDGGIRFLSTEVLELSLVSVPANADAVISTIKSIDRPLLAASGKEPKADDRPAPPGASGKSTKSVNLKPTEKKPMAKTLAEQITALESKRAAHAARMEEILTKSAEEGRSTEADEQEEFDTLSAEVDTIDADLKRFRALEKTKAAGAKPVIQNQIKTSDDGSTVRAGITIKAEKPAPGIRLARYARCLALARKQHRDLVAVAEEQYGTRDPEIIGVVKAAVIASNTTTDAALIGNEGGWADFVEFLRPRTIIGRFGQGDIPGLTRIPFRVPLITEASESAAYWVGEGKAKPMTKPSWTRTELNPLKIATIAAATMEQIRDSSPSGEVLIRDSLAKAVVKRQDLSFIDPANAGSAGVSPASILNGVTALITNGSDADAVRADVAMIMGAFVTANNPLMSGVWVMSAQRALRLSLMVNPLGQREFPGITMRGGTFFELPVITSQYVDDDVVALVNAEDIYLGDEGGIEIDMSTEASLEMVDNPTGDSIAATPVAAELVSLWQTNSVGFRAERTINWMRRRASAVAWMDDVTWGDPTSGS